MGKLVVTISVGDQQGRQFEDLECQGRREGVPLRREESCTTGKMRKDRIGSRVGSCQEQGSAVPE